MSVYYVRSTTGSDANSGASWALAKGTISGALNIAAPGDTIYVSQAHNYIVTNADINYSSWSTVRGTLNDQIAIICVNDSEQPPTQLATTAIENCMTASYCLYFQPQYIYWYGINFKASNHIRNVIRTPAIFDTCSFQITGSYNWDFYQGPFNMGIVYTAQLMPTYINCAFSTTSANTTFSCFNNYLYNNDGRSGNQGAISWEQQIKVLFKGCTWSGSAPSSFINIGSGNMYIDFTFDGCDLSILGTGSYLFANNCSNLIPGSKVCIRNSKVSPYLGLINGGYITNPQQPDVFIENCDSVGTNTRNEIYRYQGLTRVSTSVARIGGASTGTTGFSYVLAGNGFTNFILPLESHPIMTWCGTVGIQRIATVEFAHDNASPLTSADIWAELEYQGSSSAPLPTFSSTKLVTYPSFNTSAAAPLLDSSAQWASGSFTNPTYQKFQIPFTPQMAGLISIKVYLARPNYTVYIDPTITLT
jgi:hypothetical protein